MRKTISILVFFAFVANSVTPSTGLAQAFGRGLVLPTPGTMVSVSPAFEPALIKGLTVHQDNPFLFDFIVDPGQSKLPKEILKDESERMIKYFFAALTIPDRDIWVNLSPYEKNRMIPMSLGKTAMGRDLLAQDYMLKQLTASLIYPQKDLGKIFWAKVYSKAKEMYGTTQVPVNTFNKVWIVPKKVGVYEHGQTAFIVGGHLKVMLEADYLSLTKHNAVSNMSNVPASGVNQLGSQIIRQIILPEIENEVNEGKNFATLRQIFYAQALAVWFKHNLKQALLNRVYANKAAVKGIDQNDAAVNEAIYQQYLRAYKKGVFNYIKEDIDPITQESMPRKYFSGGWDGAMLGQEEYAVKELPVGKGNLAQSANLVDVKAIAETDGADAAVLAKNADAAMRISRRDLLITGVAASAGAVIDHYSSEIASGVGRLFNTNSVLRPEVRRAVDWTRDQIDPRTHLISSFEGLPLDDPSNGVTWVYNQGQAIEAFLAIGDLRNAEELANGILNLQRDNGAWYAAYNTKDATRANKLGEQMLSWVGFNVALGHSLLDLLEKTKDQQLAERILKAILRLSQWVDGYYLDHGTYGYVYSGEKKDTVWTEYNTRAFGFYYQLYNQLGDQNHPYRNIISVAAKGFDRQGLKTRADKIINWIQTKMWAGDHYQFGYKDKTGEELIPEDFQDYPTGHPQYYNREMWFYPQYIVPIMASVAGLDPRPFTKGLKWALNHQSEISITKDGKTVVLKGLPRWVGTKSVNGKFTAEMAVALQIAGLNDEADKLLSSLRILQSQSGGIPEATGNTPDNKVVWPVHFSFLSVEATVAYIIALEKFGPKYIAGTSFQKNGGQNAAMRTFNRRTFLKVGAGAAVTAAFGMKNHLEAQAPNPFPIAYTPIDLPPESNPMQFRFQVNYPRQGVLNVKFTPQGTLGATTYNYDTLTGNIDVQNYSGPQAIYNTTFNNNTIEGENLLLEMRRILQYIKQFAPNNVLGQLDNDIGSIPGTVIAGVPFNGKVGYLVTRLPESSRPRPGEGLFEFPGGLIVNQTTANGNITQKLNLNTGAFTLSNTFAPQIATVPTSLGTAWVDSLRGMITSLQNTILQSNAIQFFPYVNEQLMGYIQIIESWIRYGFFSAVILDYPNTTGIVSYGTPDWYLEWEYINSLLNQYSTLSNIPIIKSFNDLANEEIKAIFQQSDSQSALNLWQTVHGLDLLITALPTKDPTQVEWTKSTLVRQPVQEVPSLNGISLESPYISGVRFDVTKNGNFTSTSYYALFLHPWYAPYQRYAFLVDTSLPSDTLNEIISLLNAFNRINERRNTFNAGRFSITEDREIHDILQQLQDLTKTVAPLQYLGNASAGNNDKAMNVTRRALLAAGLAFVVSKALAEVPYVFKKTVVWDGNPSHQKTTVIGLSHPDNDERSRLSAFLLDNNEVRLVLGNENLRQQRAKGLKDYLSSQKDFLAKYRSAVKNIEVEINSDSTVKAFGMEGSVFQGEQYTNLQELRIIQNQIRSVLTLLLKGDNTVNIEQVIDNVNLIVFSQKQYLSLTNNRIAQMPFIGLEDANLQQQQLGTLQIYSEALRRIRSAVSQKDYTFLEELYEFPEINSVRQKDIERIRNAVGNSYKPLIDSFVKNYHDYIDVVNKRSVGMAKYIRTYGKNIIAPVGSLHYQLFVDALKSKAMESIERKENTGGIDLSQQDAAISVTKDADGGVKVNVDPALIAKVEREGLPEVVPVIINMRPADIQSLFGGKI